MDIQTKYIEKLQIEQTFIDIYSDHQGGSAYGFIIDYNDGFLILEKFSEEGNHEGISILLRENITRIKWAGNDIESTSKLIDPKKRIDYKNEIDLATKETILATVYKRFGHVTVLVEDLDKNICFVGQILELDSESVVINEFGTRISLDRKFILLSLNDITRIDAGGVYELNLKKILGI